MTDRSDITIAEFAKNGRETLRIAVGEYRGHRLVHLRSWAPHPENPGELIPTKSGLSLRRELLPQLIDALQKAAAA